LPRPSGAQAGAALLALAVAGLGLWGFAAEGERIRRLPTALDWRAAAAVLARDARPGDAVALSPRWAGRARLALPAGLPVVDAAAGDDLLGVRRLWVLSLPDVPGAGPYALPRGAPAAPERLGGLLLARHDLATPVLPVSFAPDRLAGARASLDGEPCRAVPAGFSCPESEAGAWRAVREVAGVARPCIALRADPGGTLELTIPLALGSTLRGHAARLGGAGGSALEVALAGRPVAALTPAERWERFEADTARETGRQAELHLTLAPGAGELCLDAYTLP
jgi:hypothetical protein